MNLSLEDQRRALLEQIEASRAVYRRMLTGESVAARGRVPLSASAALTDIHDRTAGPVTAGRSNWRLAGNKPSSASHKAMQWALDHPLWVAGGVALLVLALPRVAGARRRGTHDTHPRQGDQHARAVPPGQREGMGRALLATALLLLRDPARLQAASRLAGAGWRWLQRRHRH